MRVNLKMILLLGGWTLSLGGAAPAAEAPVSSELVERVRAEIVAGMGVEAGVLCSEIPSTPVAHPAFYRASSPQAVFEFSVTGAGRGTSSAFTKSSCLFCVKYLKEGQLLARTRAAFDAQARCEGRGGFLKSEPVNEEIYCSRIDGWMSHYLCSARSQATCLIPVGSSGDRRP